MKDNTPSEVVFDLPPIKFSGRSAVKELAVTVHATVDKENRVLEFLNKEIMKRMQGENEGEKGSI
jgi:hypothetical protein